MAVNYKKLNLDAAAIRDSISQRQTGIRKPENVSPYTTNRPKPTVADQTASQLPNMANISPYTSARPKPAAASSTTARANQGLPSAQQSYVQQAGAAAGNAFQQAWAREMWNRQQPAATGALQLNVGEMRNALQNGMPGNWRAANGQNSPAQAGYVSQNADTMAGLRQQMGDLADQYANRGPFQVNLANDALYKQYAQQYAQMGKRAMQDTMGQAVGLTGGYGSSYAQNVGQQAYNQQLQGLNDAALSIYDRAKARWDSEGDAMLRQMDLLGNQYERERAADTEAYSRWRDQVSDDRYAEERDYNRNWEKMKWDYGVSQDALNNEWKERDWNRTGDWHDQDFAHTLAREQVQDDQWERQFGYNQYRDQVDDNKWYLTFNRDTNQWERTFERDNSHWQQTFDRDDRWHNDEMNHWQQTFDRDNNHWQQQFDSDNSHWQQGFDREGEQWDYNVGRDTREDGWQQAMTWLKAGIVPDASVLQAAGISAADAQRLASYYSLANAGSYGGSSSGGRSSGRRSSSGGTPPRTPQTPQAPQTPQTPQTAQIGSAAWIDSFAKQYGRLANSSQSRDGLLNSVTEAYIKKYGAEPDKSNKTAYNTWHNRLDKLWSSIQQQAIDGGYIRGYQNADENLTDDRFSQDVIDYWARKFGQSRQNAALAQAFANTYGTGAAAKQAWERIKQLSADYYPGHANAYPGLG